MNGLYIHDWRPIYNVKCLIPHAYVHLHYHVQHPTHTPGSQTSKIHIKVVFTPPKCSHASHDDKRRDPKQFYALHEQQDVSIHPLFFLYWFCSPFRSRAADIRARQENLIKQNLNRNEEGFPENISIFVCVCVCVCMCLFWLVCVSVCVRSGWEKKRIASPRIVKFGPSQKERRDGLTVPAQFWSPHPARDRLFVAQICDKRCPLPVGMRWWT